MVEATVANAVINDQYVDVTELDITATGTVRLSSVTDMATAEDALITAETLIIDKAATIDFNTNVDNLSVNGVTGSAVITEKDDVNLIGSALTGDLYLTAADGTITIDGEIVQAGNLELLANNIEITDASVIANDMIVTATEALTFAGDNELTALSANAEFAGETITATGTLKLSANNAVILDNWSSTTIRSPSPPPPYTLIILRPPLWKSSSITTAPPQMRISRSI